MRGIWKLGKWRGVCEQGGRGAPSTPSHGTSWQERKGITPQTFDGLFALDQGELPAAEVVGCLHYYLHRGQLGGGERHTQGVGPGDSGGESNQQKHNKDPRKFASSNSL